jgi:hypothetical protein
MNPKQRLSRDFVRAAQRDWADQASNLLWQLILECCASQTEAQTEAHTELQKKLVVHDAPQIVVHDAPQTVVHDAPKTVVHDAPKTLMLNTTTMTPADKSFLHAALQRAMRVACRNDAETTVRSIWTCLNRTNEAETLFCHGCDMYTPARLVKDCYPCRVRPHAALCAFLVTVEYNSPRALQALLELKLYAHPSKSDSAHASERQDNFLLDVNAFDARGRYNSAVYYACNNSRAEATRLLIRAKARLDVGALYDLHSSSYDVDSFRSWTPLHAAVQTAVKTKSVKNAKCNANCEAKRNAKCIRHLLAAKADVNAVFSHDDHNTESVLKTAVASGNPGAVRALLRAKACVGRNGNSNVLNKARERLLDAELNDMIKDKSATKTVQRMRVICRLLEEATT